jgi:hypothetical protein
MPSPTLIGSTAGSCPSPEISALAEGTGSRELGHTAVVDAERWAEFGPSAVGVGWDLALLGLSLHPRGGSIEDPLAWQESPEARDFVTPEQQRLGGRERGRGRNHR